MKDRKLFKESDNITFVSPLKKPDNGDSIVYGVSVGYGYDNAWISTFNMTTESPYAKMIALNFVDMKNNGIEEFTQGALSVCIDVKDDLLHKLESAKVPVRYTPISHRSIMSFVHAVWARKFYLVDRMELKKELYEIEHADGKPKIIQPTHSALKATILGWIAVQKPVTINFS